MIKSSTYIIYLTWILISKCRSSSIKLAVVCLLTARRSVRRRLRPATTTVCCREAKGPCGEAGGNSQAYTLSPSQRLCVYVSPYARVSVFKEVQVRAYLKKQPWQSSTHFKGYRYANWKEYAFKFASTHFIWTRLNTCWTHTLSDTHLNTDV